MVIEGYRNKNRGTVSVDALTVRKGPCQPLGYNNFENGFGTYVNAPTGQDQFDWTVRKGITKSSGTGPSADHTLNNDNGKSYILELSSLYVHGV